MLCVQLFHYLTALLLFACVATSDRVTNPKKVPKNAVLLSKVASLTLRGDKKTAHRRVSAVPQLKCVGPLQVCKLYQIDVMRCTNEGADYEAENIQWSCKASVPEEFKLGSTDVSCEGYESSTDPYVLKGSCGVEYRLLLTKKGEAKYDMHLPANEDKGSHSVMSVLVVALFLVVLFIIVRGCLNSFRLRADGRGDIRRGGSGGGGGGGWDGDDHDPPPPYDPDSRYTTSYRTHKKTPSYPRAGSSRTAGGTTRTQENWRPGFWTGAATGAAATAATNWMTGTRSQPNRYPETAERPTGSGIFGGGSGTRSSWGMGPSSRPNSSDSNHESSSSRHDSTGFGGTSRR